MSAWTRSLLRRRLEAQHIAATSFTRPEDVVEWLGAVQAQDYLGALWAVGLRMADAREQDIDRAIADRRIVRTWPMRGTLHFVSASDARWMTALLASRPAARAASRLAAAGIDEALLARARRVLVKNLEGGRRLTRPEAYRALEGAKIATRGSRGLYVLWRLAHDGLLCFGPRQGKQLTFVLFEEWLPRAKPLPRDEALAALARRYFVGHGPATLADFVWWSGLTTTDARVAVHLAAEEIDEETIGGQQYWSAPRAAERCPGGTRVAHVLPAFDEFLVGYADRSAAMDAPAGIARPTIVVGGRVVGTWARRITRGQVAFSTVPFTSLSGPKSHAVDLELRRYARFLGLGVGGAEPKRQR
jgi:hypothetical protein